MLTGLLYSFAETGKRTDKTLTFISTEQAVRSYKIHQQSFKYKLNTINLPFCRFSRAR